MKALAKKSLNISTVYDALNVSIQFLMNEGMTATQEYINDFDEYSPDWTLTPLIIIPRAYIADPSGDNPLATYNPTEGQEVAETNIIANTSVFTNMAWYKVTDAGNILLEEGADYSIALTGANRGALTVKKNLNVSDGRTLLFTGTFIDTRTGLSQKIARPVTLTCTASTITSLKSRLLTPKGVSFDLKTSYLPITQKLYLGNEECQHDVVRWWEKDGVAIPASDIAYVDQDRVSSFMNRVVAAGATRTNEKMLRRVLYQNRRWMDKTELLLVPECGCKVVDNKLETVFNIAKVNDAVMATAANRPYAGGLIATGEKAKIKTSYNGTTIALSHTAVSLSNNYHVAYIFEPIDDGTIYFSSTLQLQIQLKQGYITVTNGTQSIQCLTSGIQVFGRMNVFQLNVIENNAFIYINNVLIGNGAFGAISIEVIAFNNQYQICPQTLAGLIGISRTLSASESQSLHAFLSNEFPDIEAVTVGSQRIATSNLETTQFGPITIPEVQSAGTEGNAELITNGTFATNLDGWTAAGTVGVAWSAGGANFTDGWGNFHNGVPLAAGKVYKISITMARTSGNIFVYTGTRFVSINASATFYQQAIETGFFNLYSDAFVGSISAVSVKEVGTELITAEEDRTFSSDTGFWAKGGSTAIADGVMHLIGTDLYLLTKSNFLKEGKWYNVVINVPAISAGVIVMNCFSEQKYIYPGEIGEKSYVVKAATTEFRLYAFGSTAANIDNVSITELGWSDAQFIFDQRKVAGDTDLQANIAAAMWAKYNNDDAIAAIYGKFYNLFAVAIMAEYPIPDWHIGSAAEWQQLSDYLGGNNVSGSKTKALFSGFNNEFSTNESGISLLPGGYIDRGVLQNGIGIQTVYQCDPATEQIFLMNSDNKIYPGNHLLATGLAYIRLFADTPFTEPNPNYYPGDTIVIPVTDADDGSGELTITCKSARITTNTIIDGGTTKATDEQIAKISAGLWRPSVTPEVFAQAASVHTESVLLKYKMEDVMVDIVCPTAVKSNVKMVNPSVVLTNNLGIIENPQERFSFKWIGKHHNGTQVVTTDLGYGSNIMVPLVALTQNIEVETKQGFEFAKYKLVPNGTSDTLVIPFIFANQPIIRFIIDFIPSTLVGEKILAVIGNGAEAVKIFTNGDLLMLQTSTAEYAITTIVAGKRTMLNFATNFMLEMQITEAKLDDVPFAPDRSAVAWAPVLTGLAKHTVADMIMYENGSLTHRWTFAGTDDATRKADKISGTLNLTTTATFQKL